MPAATNHKSEDAGSVSGEAPPIFKCWGRVNARRMSVQNEGAYLVFIEGLGGWDEHIMANIRQQRVSRVRYSPRSSVRSFVILGDLVV
ncbi:hypothetical protein F511_36094 [Dorcoceras hygrometricum]|uniref:Uncharacterized protein n=1 Tax=Dorcoceras hygrometricum TaxID=472368 RepID=A0A2Z7C6M3_9LAMI|nr:hypothetical protein F511_36094 [Dorcoceras hygrometricum]